MSKRRSPELSGRPRRRACERVRREQPNCYRCGKPIDLTLDRQTHPMGSTVDELIPRSRAVDPKRAALDYANLKHMHRECNNAKSDSLEVETRHSREW